MRPSLSILTRVTGLTTLQDMLSASLVLLKMGEPGEACDIDPKQEASES